MRIPPRAPSSRALPPECIAASHNTQVDTHFFWLLFKSPRPAGRWGHGGRHGRATAVHRRRWDENGGEQNEEPASSSVGAAPVPASGVHSPNTPPPPPLTTSAGVSTGRRSGAVPARALAPLETRETRRVGHGEHEPADVAGGTRAQGYLEPTSIEVRPLDRVPGLPVHQPREPAAVTVNLDGPPRLVGVCLPGRLHQRDQARLRLPEWSRDATRDDIPSLHADRERPSQRDGAVCECCRFSPSPARNRQHPVVQAVLGRAWRAGAGTGCARSPGNHLPIVGAHRSVSRRAGVPAACRAIQTTGRVGLVGAGHAEARPTGGREVPPSGVVPCRASRAGRSRSRYVTGPELVPDTEPEGGDHGPGGLQRDLREGRGRPGGPGRAARGTQKAPPGTHPLPNAHPVAWARRPGGHPPRGLSGRREAPPSLPSRPVRFAVRVAAQHGPADVGGPTPTSPRRAEAGPPARDQSPGSAPHTGDLRLNRVAADRRPDLPRPRLGRTRRSSRPRCPARKNVHGEPSSRFLTPPSPPKAGVRLLARSKPVVVYTGPAPARAGQRPLV